MNVFVTGGAGYIGSICVEEMLNAGHRITVFDNLTEGHRSAVDARASFVLGLKIAASHERCAEGLEILRGHPVQWDEAAIFRLFGTFSSASSSPKGTAWHSGRSGSKGARRRS